MHEHPAVRCALFVQSEYVSDADARRAFLSDFTGSAGTAVVLKQEAYMWTDGRYVLQASQQCDSSVWTIKQTQPKSLTMPDHLPEILPPASKVFDLFEKKTNLSS
jgi:Xaa-Pro aminopeptidase